MTTNEFLEMVKTHKIRRADLLAALDQQDEELRQRKQKGIEEVKSQPGLKT